MSKLIVVSDLDGTLLDHHTYQYNAALPALHQLRQVAIPLILNSSKTAAEMLVLRRELDNHDPFIVENGAGVYVPAGEPVPEAARDTEDVELQGLEKVALGMDRAELLDALRRLRQSKGYRFTGFADMDTARLAACTGLDETAASRALRRDFTEPLLWEDTEARFVAFRRDLEQAGICVTRGGRFIHVSGPADKGRALDWLRDYYARLSGERPKVIALGDAENDRAMLERADHPVLIKSATAPPPAIRHGSLLRTEEEGPAGWNTAVLSLLRSLGATGA